MTYAFLALFLVMIGYFSWFVYADSEEVINNAYNKRADVYSQRVVRGDIISSDGEVLAYTKTDSDGNETRVYPYGEALAHAVGYTTEGLSGIESLANIYMLRSHSFILEYLKNEITGNKNEGDDATVTLDASLCQTAYDALGDYDGAVVAIRPSTGEIVAMVSKPSFDPNTLEENYDDYVEDSDDESVLLNRATQGLYPPGSTFKIFTALEYLRENDYDDSDYSFVCDGSVAGDSITIHCYKNSVHGTLSLKQAFAKSCNGAFATIGLGLDISDFTDLVEGALFNSSLPCVFSYSKSSFALDSDSTDDEIMHTAIGQGETLVTPYHMALVACAIDNGGVLMSPYVLSSIDNDEGVNVKTFESEEYGSLFTEKDAETIKKYMRKVVTDGTGSDLSGKSYKAYGKTGSAEYSDSDDSTHAWFVGFASKEGYEDLAIAVIVEDSGSGSKYAVPVAEEIFDEYFSE